MTRKSRRLLVASMAVMLLAAISATGVAAHDGGRGRSDLAKAVAATARYHDVRNAVRDGYALPDAPAPLHECISSFDDTGAMGFHYINGSLLDTKLDPAKPEALVYAPDRWGRLHLVALEYVVFQEPWMAEHGSAMPRLFHQTFMATGAPNRYEIPAFFALHVWLWKFNPSGLFAPFNPRVSCDPGNHRHHGAPAKVVSTKSTYACSMPKRAATTTSRPT